MLRIFEPLYKVGQQQAEPLFLPLPLANNDFAWREFRIYVDFYRQGRHRGPGRCGIFSPKFHLKSKIQTSQFFDFCLSHEEADVCFLNPFPQVRYLAYNVWGQGEPWHPGLMQAAQSLMDAVGIPWKMACIPRHDERFLAFSNFWVANEKFWNAYVGGVLIPIADFLQQQPDHPAAALVMQDTYHTDQAPFLPFIIERLFSTFISLHPEFGCKSYPISDIRPYCLNEEEWKIVTAMKPLVDSADEQGYFSTDLMEALNQAASSNTTQAKRYFQNNPHPHSGKLIPVHPVISS
mgnify:CR=1 FL=1